jgi:CRISPR-associated protein Csx16
VENQRGFCFINLTNHPSSKWDDGQIKAAHALAGRIEDVAFPAVPPDADEKAIRTLADECLSQVPPETTHALVQGEFTLTFELVRRLQARRITCLAATTTRNVEEEANGHKVSSFAFVRFRAYPELGPA